MSISRNTPLRIVESWRLALLVFTVLGVVLGGVLSAGAGKQDFVGTHSHSPGAAAHFPTDDDHSDPGDDTSHCGVPTCGGSFAFIQKGNEFGEPDEAAPALSAHDDRMWLSLSVKGDPPVPRPGPSAI